MHVLGTKVPIFKASVVVEGGNVITDFSLDLFLGKKEVRFFFYPKDFSFACPTEWLCFQPHLPSFTARSVALVGGSTDTEETHAAWFNTPHTKEGLAGVTYPFVSDTSKAIASNSLSWDFFNG